jgi:hypothetical protein
MSIVLVGSTSGSITLQEPAVAGSTVLDLPAVSGTFITTASSGQSIPSAALPVGSVLQVVNAVVIINAQTSSTTYVDTGVSASITPKFSTSKILVVVDMAGIYKNTADIYGLMRLVRNSTEIAKMEGAYGYNGTSQENNVGVAGITYLDNPATTSATTYKTQISVNTALGNVGIGRNGSTSSITLMEIAA